MSDDLEFYSEWNEVPGQDNIPNRYTMQHQASGPYFHQESTVHTPFRSSASQYQAGTQIASGQTHGSVQHPLSNCPPLHFGRPPLGQFNSGHVNYHPTLTGAGSAEQRPAVYGSLYPHSRPITPVLKGTHSQQTTRYVPQATSGLQGGGMVAETRDTGTKKASNLRSKAGQPRAPCQCICNCTQRYYPPKTMEVTRCAKCRGSKDKGCGERPSAMGGAVSATQQIGSQNSLVQPQRSNRSYAALLQATQATPPPAMPPQVLQRYDKPPNATPPYVTSPNATPPNAMPPYTMPPHTSSPPIAPVGFAPSVIQATNAAVGGHRSTSITDGIRTPVQTQGAMQTYNPPVPTEGLQHSFTQTKSMPAKSQDATPYLEQAAAALVATTTDPNTPIITRMPDHQPTQHGKTVESDHDGVNSKQDAANTAASHDSNASRNFAIIAPPQSGTTQSTSLDETTESHATESSTAVNDAAQALAKRLKEDSDEIYIRLLARMLADLEREAEPWDVEAVDKEWYESDASLSLGLTGKDWSRVPDLLSLCTPPDSNMLSKRKRSTDDVDPPKYVHKHRRIATDSTSLDGATVVTSSTEPDAGADVSASLRG